MDGNKQAKFTTERNHPRVLQQPAAAMHWGCNADFQSVLTNNVIYQNSVDLGVPYRTFVDTLLKIGIFGLEQFRVADNTILYVTSYNIKGNKSSSSWTQVMKLIANDMCAGANRHCDLCLTSFWSMLADHVQCQETENVSNCWGAALL
jgi:hypothetical protein